jgi:hypothetical protein
MKAIVFHGLGGVYPETMPRFPIGMAMMKNLTMQG